MLKVLLDLGWNELPQARAALYLHSWLILLPEVLRVGKDYWMLIDHLPEEFRHTRLAVLSQRTDITDSAQTGNGLNNDPGEPTQQALIARSLCRSIEDDIVIGGQPDSMTANWKATLRTIHLQEGFIPIPKKVWSIYPPLVPGEGKTIASRGGWFDDNSFLWLWIDREKNRIYGPDLRQLFDNELLDPGTALQVNWAQASIFLRRVDVNEQIHEEKSRLVDLEELKQLRGGLGESYCRSLQIILTAHPQGLTLAELIAALRERQQHEAHRGGIRALLYSGGFLHKGQHWFASPEDARCPPRIPCPVGADGTTPVSRETFVRTRGQVIGKRLQEIVSELKGKA